MSWGWSILSSLWAAADLSVWEREGDAQVWEPSSDPFPATMTPTPAQSRLTGLLAVLKLDRSGADEEKKEIYTVVTDSELLKAISLGPQLNAVSKQYKRAI